MCDLLDYYDRIFLNQIATEQLRLLQEFVQAPVCTRAETKIKCLRAFKKFVEKKAEGMVVQNTAECLCHDEKCPTCPEVDDKSVWAEAISPSCVNWSSQGLQHRWLGEESLPLIAWAISIRKMAHPPDMVLLECTPQLDLNWLNVLSGGRLQWRSSVLGPMHVGLPVSGQRIWAVAAGGKLKYRDNPFADETLVQCVFRKVVGKPAMFLFESKGEVYEYLDSLNQGRLKKLSAKRFRPEDYLTASSSCRLHFHRLKAANVREVLPELLDSPMYMDISQNVNWTRRMDGSLPRPTTSTMLWIDTLERPMLPIELAAAQGWGMCMFAYVYRCMYACKDSKLTCEGHDGHWVQTGTGHNGHWAHSLKTRMWLRWALGTEHWAQQRKEHDDVHVGAECTWHWVQMGTGHGGHWVQGLRTRQQVRWARGTGYRGHWALGRQMKQWVGGRLQFLFSCFHESLV